MQSEEHASHAGSGAGAVPVPVGVGATAPPAPAPAHTAAVAKVVSEARKKFVTALDDELLDYKHNHPQLIEACAKLLIKVFSNIVQNPEEAKFRQIKATSAALKTSVYAVKGGEHLLMLAGFKAQVVDLQKYWVFESDSHGIKDSILSECCSVLQRATKTIHEKAERKIKEHEDKLSAEKERREQILLQLEDDKAGRKVRAVAAAAPGQHGAEEHGGAAAAAAAAAAAPLTQRLHEERVGSAAAGHGSGLQQERPMDADC